jgi:hypothetical protein
MLRHASVHQRAWCVFAGQSGSSVSVYCLVLTFGSIALLSLFSSLHCPLTLSLAFFLLSCSLPLFSIYFLQFFITSFLFLSLLYHPFSLISIYPYGFLLSLTSLFTFSYFHSFVLCYTPEGREFESR